MRYKKHYKPWVWNVLGNVKYKALRGLIAVMLMIVSTIRFFVVSIPKDLCSLVKEAWGYFIQNGVKYYMTFGIGILFLMSV